MPILSNDDIAMLFESLLAPVGIPLGGNGGGVPRKEGEGEIILRHDDATITTLPVFNPKKLYFYYIKFEDGVLKPLRCFESCTETDVAAKEVEILDHIRNRRFDRLSNILGMDLNETTFIDNRASATAMAEHSYLTIYLDNEDWELAWDPQTNSVPLILFNVKKATSPGKPFKENYSFFTPIRVDQGRGQGVRIRNYMATNKLGQQIPSAGGGPRKYDKYTFDIYVKAPMADITTNAPKADKFYMIIDPDGQNQGPQ